MNPTSSSLSEALTLLSDPAEKLDPNLKTLPLDKFEAYLKGLIAYNEHTNLVAKSDPGTLIRDHVLDSLSLFALLPPESHNQQTSLIDIGSGAGFPALVLALVNPRLKVTLVESITKKARFLTMSVSELGLSPRVTVINGRAEELSPRLRESFNLATARAVGSLDYLIEMTFPFLQLGGRLLAPKSSRQMDEEDRRAEVALLKLGGGVKRAIPQDKAILGRDLVIFEIEKTVATPAKYPRTQAEMKRKPLGI